MTKLFRNALFASALGGMMLLASGCTPPSEMSIDTAAAGAAKTSSPASLGFSTEGLETMKAEFRQLVDDQKLAGITTLLARHGHIVHFDAYGKASTATGEELKSDAIFRIASMTKPVAGVAMMQLWEQGKWKLDDPVALHIPEFANLQVKTANGGTEPPRSLMTMAQLMSHSAGFGASATYADAGLASSDLQGLIDKLAQLPLETHPGTAWDYGPVVDIQGYLVEKLSGQKLDEYLDQHIFNPLGMVDTGFWTPKEKAHRVVAIHTYDKDGKITTSGENRIITEKPRFLSSSGGLMSTTEDYWRFAQALGNGGELNGRRILKEDTVKLMRTNVLEHGVKVDLYGFDWEGIGFGMDFAIVMDPPVAKTSQGKGSFYWAGAFGTWFWIDPANDVVFVGMIQNINGSRPNEGTPQMRPLSYQLVYKALTDPSK